MSRGGGFETPAATQITGQLGSVITDNAPIYAGREQYGQLLFRVPKDQQVIVSGETDKYYAVVMSNHTLGFIAKTDVQLLDIHQTVSGISTSANTVAAAQNAPPLVQRLLQSASLYFGVAPYVWGGNTIDGIDCSGFVKAVYTQNGITLPRTAAEQAKVGYEVPLRDLSQWYPGDRMYFQCHHGYIDHTGMYVGNGYFIHSSVNHGGVALDKVSTPYYWDHLVAVRRSNEVVAALQGMQQTVSAPDYESNQE